MVVKSAGFIIFRRTLQIEFLLMQASYGDHHWTPPKGHVDHGESDYKTALRETKEEAGLAESDLKVYPDFKKTLEYGVRGKPKEVVYRLAELVNKDKKVVTSSEHQAFKWLPIDKAAKLSGRSDFSKLLHECHAFINKGASKKKQ